MRNFDEIPHRKILFSFILLASLVFYKYSQPIPNELLGITGVTMGVIPYNIVVNTNKSPAFLYKLKESTIDPELARLNQIFSTYIEDSEIVKINESKTDEEILVSREMYEVLQISKVVHEKTNGCFDPTLGVLINLWGFGSKVTELPEVSDDEVAQAKELMGFASIELLGANKIRKLKNVQLNLSAVAKGYVVDCVGALLEKNGLSDYLVEIGGEIYTKGKKTEEDNFLIGLEQPFISETGEWNPIELKLKMEQLGVATSGNYRNFYLKEGKKYAHIINPQTGYPAENGVIRVAIIADTCAYADAYATAIMVMGKEKGLDFLNKEARLHGLITTREADSLHTYESVSFSSFVVPE